MQALVDRCLRRRLVIVASLAIAALRFVGAPSVARAQGQTGIVVGRVTDTQSGQPIAGAAVQVVGTRLGAATGDDGRYRIVGVPAGTYTIAVLRLGFLSSRQLVTIAIGATVSHEVALRATAVTLDQIVVTGTAGETERRSIGNAVSTIDASSEMAKASPPDIAQLLRARAPGLDIQPISGRIGTGPSIQIRGPSSIGLSNNPLIYIDGVRVNNSTNLGPTGISGGLGAQGNPVESRMNDINPEDIESIEVIKGPAAASLYGTEAANGVIQIITKKGASDRAQLRSSITAGPMYFRDAEGRVPTNYDKDKASGNIVPWNGVKAMADSGTPIFKTGLERHYSTAVSGGVDQLRYYASLGYENDYGVEPNNLQREFNAHMNLSTPLGTRTDVSTSLNVIDMSTHLGADVGASALLGAIAGHSLLPFKPAALGFYPGFPPAVPQTLYDNATGLNRFTGSATVNNQLTRWFTQRGILGLDYTNQDDRAIEHFAPPNLASILSPAAAGGRIGQTLRRTTMITADYSGTAKVNLSPALAASTSVGGQFNNSEANVSFLGGQGFPASGVETVTAAATAVAATQSQTINTTIGGYAQEQFAWRDRLFLVGALRVDNNSSFGADFKWVTYPKASASWVVSDEPFWKWSDRINTLRVRAAYGAAGRQPAAFSALQTFSPVVGPNGTNAVTPNTLGNADLHPERGTETELGFEAGLFNRLSIDFTHYDKTTNNEIVNQPVAPSTGFAGSQLVNLGKVVNNGIELQARLQAITRRDLNWEITGNFTTINNTIKSNITNVVTSTNQYNIVGYPIGGLWTKRVVSADRDPTTNGAINVLCDGGPGKAPVACASAPFVYVGNPTPSKTFSLGNTLMLGNSLRLYALIDGRRGNRIWNQNEEIRCDGLAGAPLCRANYYPLEYSPTYLADAALSAFVTGNLDAFMQDGSFVKLRELSATYFIPRRLLPRVANPSITFAARELHTWTSYGGIDPEGAAQSGGSNSGATAIDQGVVPPLTRFLVTFNFSW
jgi:TonB-linked SusC/RagA family outer membrane protein